MSREYPRGKGASGEEGNYKGGATTFFGVKASQNLPNTPFWGSKTRGGHKEGKRVIGG